MASRRNVRLRREYLYRKGLEGTERAEYEKKRQLREALREGKPIPSQLRPDEARLRHDIELEDEETATPATHVDDEYASAGMVDPVICVTTSRDPSARLKQFVKEVRLIFPGATRVNRGNMRITELVETCRNNGMSDLIMVHETRGEPDGLTVCHLPYGPTAFFTLSGVVMRHDIDNVGTISEAFPHIILNDFETQLGTRVANVLRHLFPVPKEESKRIVTFSAASDYISFRHHVYKQTGHKNVALQECGPRFEMRLFQLRLGTVDQLEAQNEWVLRPYMNSAKRQRVL